MNGFGFSNQRYVIELTTYYKNISYKLTSLYLKTHMIRLNIVTVCLKYSSIYIHKNCIFLYLKGIFHLLFFMVLNPL